MSHLMQQCSGWMLRAVESSEPPSSPIAQLLSWQQYPALKKIPVGIVTLSDAKYTVNALLTENAIERFTDAGFKVRFKKIKIK